MRVRKRTRTRESGEDTDGQQRSRTRVQGDEGSSPDAGGDARSAGRARSGDAGAGDGQPTGDDRDGESRGGQARAGQSKGGQSKGGQSKGGGQGKGGGKRRRNRSSQRGGQRPKQPKDGRQFWGDASRLPSARTDVRISNDPDAVPRSLGPPPLPGHEQIAAHYFGVVYDRAVMTASALAAAGGLIDPDALTGEDEED